MKNRKFISVLMAVLLLASSVCVMTSCGKKEEEKKPETLEEYVEVTEGAADELARIGDSMSNELLDGSCDIKGNSIILTLTMKETYDSKYFDAFGEGFADKLDEKSDDLVNMIDEMEKSSGIQGIDMQVFILNGDGEEIYSDTFTK